MQINTWHHSISREFYDVLVYVMQSTEMARGSAMRSWWILSQDYGINESYYACTRLLDMLQCNNAAKLNHFAHDHDKWSSALTCGVRVFAAGGVLLLARFAAASFSAACAIEEENIQRIATIETVVRVYGASKLFWGKPPCLWIISIPLSMWVICNFNWTLTWWETQECVLVR